MPKRTDSSLDRPALARLLTEQDGVVSRRQLVSVDHTGRPTRRQLEWAVVLLCAPAALHRESALDAHGLSEDRPPEARSGTRIVHVLVGPDRRIAPRDGIEVERVTNWSAWVLDNRRPPRAKLEYALLKAASRRTEVEAIALLSDAVQQGRTTAERLLAVLEELVRLPGRAALAEVLSDVATGAWSVLEHRYLTQVERAHGLPAGERGRGVRSRAVPAVRSPTVEPAAPPRGPQLPHRRSRAGRTKPRCPLSPGGSRVAP